MTLTQRTTFSKSRGFVQAALCCLVAISASQAQAQTGKQWYVSPAGAASNSGTLTSPLSLTAAIAASSPVRPGDVIWLRGGSYKQTYTSRLTGTAAAPIVVAQYPGERAILDGNNAEAVGSGYVLYVMGAHTWFVGFEVTSTATHRVDSGGPNAPSGVVLGASNNIKFINLVVHDMPGQGMGIWSYNTDAEVYGCLIYHNGLSPQFDHGLYVQNQTGIKYIADNIIVRQASHGIHAYGSSAASLDNIQIDGNIVADNGVIAGSGARNILLGGGTVARNPVVTSNYTYYRGSGGHSNIGYAAGTTNAQVSGNYFVGGSAAIRLNTSSNLTVTGNLFAGPLDPPDLATRYPSNTFLASKPTTGAAVFVRPNKYETGRATLTIYNWARTATVAVSLATTGLVAGDAFEIRDALNFFGPPVVAGTYSGAAVNVPMIGLVAADPYNDSLTNAPHTAPTFGAFLVRKTGTGGGGGGGGGGGAGDTTPPSVSVTAPTSGSVIAGTIALAAAASDDVGVAGVQFQIDGRNVGTEVTTAPFSAILDTTAETNASHVITARARDAAGNIRTSAGVAVTISNSPPVGNAPHVGVTAAKADFTGDGRPDLLWHHESGLVALWAMQGFKAVERVDVGSAGAGWHLAGSGDLDGGGTPEVIWHNRTEGSLYVWKLSGGTVYEGAPLSPSRVSAGWQIGAIADMNGDRKADIIWQHDAGWLAVWFMDGVNMVGSQNLNPAAAHWRLAGAGDINNDMLPDLIWHAPATGEVGAWLMNGTTVAGMNTLSVPVVALGWKPVGVVDLTGDGISDIVWQHAEGWLVVWSMSGYNVAGSHNLDPGGVSPAWRLAAPR